MYLRLTAGKQKPERLLDAAFRFLLDREPKESILRRFDAEIIGRYFPEFERELPHLPIARHLSRAGVSGRFGRSRGRGSAPQVGR